MAEIEPQEVRDHLERVVASKEFAESERLRRFLRFTVESKLTQQHERVKEYVLGREVFDRQDGYDPRVDPIVRVEARRLRSKLEEYYGGAGRAEPIRFEYVKGSYLPVFQRVHFVPPLRAALSRPPVLAAIAAAALIAAAVAFALAVRQPPPMVAAIPLRWIQADSTGLDASDVSLAEAVNDELANRGVARVLAWPLVTAHQHDRVPMQQLARAMGVGKLLVVIVRDIGNQKRITVFLIDARTGQKLRAQEYFRSDVSSYAVQHALARQITADLAKKLT
jgi:TolB-like protein